MDDKIKHTSKDSVFACLFQDLENAMRLYLSLHPEDKTVTLDDCELFNLRSVLVAGIYNRPVAKPQKYSQRRSPCIMRLNVI